MLASQLDLHTVIEVGGWSCTFSFSFSPLLMSAVLSLSLSSHVSVRMCVCACLLCRCLQNQIQKHAYAKGVESSACLNFMHPETRWNALTAKLPKLRKLRLLPALRLAPLRRAKKR